MSTSNLYPTLNDALFAAAKAGDAMACRDLLSQGAKVNARKWAHSPLHEAAFTGNIDTCCVLLDAGAHIESVGRFNWTPLHWAAGNNTNAAAVVHLLIERGANVHAKNIDGDTPLHRAIQCNSGGALLALLEGGADLDLPNTQGLTPRKDAASKLPGEIKVWLTRQSALQAIDEINSVIEKTSTAAKTASKPKP